MNKVTDADMIRYALETVGDGFHCAMPNFCYGPNHPPVAMGTCGVCELAYNMRRYAIRKGYIQKGQ